MSTVIYVKSSTGVLLVAEKVVWYVADGTEGNTLVFDGTLTLLKNGVEINLDLTGKKVIGVNRENYEQKPTLLSDPTNKEFNWESSTATLRQANNLESGELIKITYTQT